VRKDDGIPRRVPLCGLTMLLAMWMNFVLLAITAHAAPITLGWECGAGACATYAIYRDIGCLGRWTFLRHITTPAANVMTPPDMITCWRIAAVSVLWEESQHVEEVHVAVGPLPDTDDGFGRYVVVWRHVPTP
jgi:hypothetical protein